MIFFAIFQNFVESIHPAINPVLYEEKSEQGKSEEKDILDVCENNITINDDVICNCNICFICRYIMNHCGYRNAKLKGI